MITVVNKVSAKVPYYTIHPGEFFAMDDGKNLYYKMENGYVHIGQAGNPRSCGSYYVSGSSYTLDISFPVSRVDVTITIS